MPEATRIFPNEFFNCSISSPPYWALRDYSACNCNIRRSAKDNSSTLAGGGNVQLNRGKPDLNCPKCGGTGKDKAVEGKQLGLEPTFEEYIDKLCTIYDEVKRVLRPDGTCWVNLGDTYWGGKGQSGRCDHNIEQRFAEGRTFQRREYTLPTKHCPQDGKHEFVQAKSLCLIPQRFAIEMVNRGWILRNVIIWHKPNPMPSSAKDRFTVDFEYIFFFTKSNDPTHWIHSLDGLLSSTKPKPDYLWTYYTGIETRQKPYMAYWTRHIWKRRNLWEGQDYWFEPQYEPYILPMNRWGGIYTDGNVEGSKYLKEDIDPAQLTQRPRSMRPNALGRNKRTVWTIPTQPYPEAHFATFPEKLVEPIILSGCPEFVCKKCGMGRRKVYETKQVGDEPWRTEPRTVNARQAEKVLSYSDKYSVLNTFKGYTDCGCNAGFRPGIVCDPFRWQLHHWQRSCKTAA